MKILKTLLRKKTKVIDGKVWRLMKRKEVNAEIYAKGCKVDSRILCYFKSGDYGFYKSELDENKFLSVIWPEMNVSRLLTPECEPRTIRDVAERLIKCHTFESLCQDQGRPDTEHDPSWFDKCLKIDSEFDYDRFCAMWLVEENCIEHKQSPLGKYYIQDGAHRSLVLGKRLLKCEEEYCPVKAILIDPRPPDD